jgi:hypothetical protein
MASTFGDAFSLQQRQQLAQANFKVGAVLKIFDNIAQKEKRIILIGFRYDKIIVAFLRINTEINASFFPTAALRNEHLELEKNEAQRPYLDHTSFVDCSVFVELKVEEIFNKLVDTPSIHIGEVSEDDLKSIKQKVAASRLLSKTQKKNFGVFFPPQ